MKFKVCRLHKQIGLHIVTVRSCLPKRQGYKLSENHIITYYKIFHGHTLPSADLISCLVLCLVQNVQRVLIKRLVGLSLPKISVVRLSDRPKMTIPIYRGR